jgi:hypothetical protein
MTVSPLLTAAVAPPPAGTFSRPTPTPTRTTARQADEAHEAHEADERDPAT